MVTINQNFTSANRIVGVSVPAPTFKLQRFAVTTDTTTADGGTFLESVFKQITTAAGFDAFRVVAGNPLLPFTLTSLAPSVASVSGDTITAVGSGGQFNVMMTQGGGSVQITGISTTGAKVIKFFDNFTAGTLSATLANGILDRITDGKSQAMYLSNPLTTNAQLNPDCVANGIDLSGIPIATTLFGGWSAANRGFAPTPQHVVGARHWQSSYPANMPNGTGFQKGQSFKFRGADGSEHIRRVIGVGYSVGDIAVATLDSPLPASVTPLAIAGEWFMRDQVQHNGLCDYYVGGVMMYVDQFFNCCIQIGGSEGSINTVLAYTEIVNGHTYTNCVEQILFRGGDWFAGSLPGMFAGKPNFLKSGIVGDSGSACFIVKAGVAVVVGTLWYPDACSNLVSHDGALVNEAIINADASAGISTGYTVTVAASP